MHAKPTQLLSTKSSFLRKALSECVGYNTDPLLIFLLYDTALARSTMAKLALAEKRQVTPDVLADCKQLSEGYWAHERDYLCDIVRQMAKRCANPRDDSELWAYCHTGEPKSLAYPNVFLIIAPGEWIFPLPAAILGNFKNPEGLSLIHI